jgi:hypothetical protein
MWTIPSWRTWILLLEPTTTNLVLRTDLFILLFAYGNEIYLVVLGALEVCVKTFQSFIEQL